MRTVVQNQMPNTMNTGMSQGTDHCLTSKAAQLTIQIRGIYVCSF